MLASGSMATFQDFSAQLKDIYENLVRQFGAHTVSLGVPDLRHNIMGPSFPLGTQDNSPSSDASKAYLG